MIPSWLADFEFSSGLAAKKRKSKGNPLKSTTGKGRVFFLGKNDTHHVSQLISKEALPWQKESLLKQDRELIYFISETGPVWIVHPTSAKSENSSGQFQDSDYSWSRDLLGSLLSHFRAHQLDFVDIEFCATNDDQDLGALVGFDLAAYQFRSVFENKKISFPAVQIRKTRGVFRENIFDQAQKRAVAVNWARHWVNLPPNELNPQSFSSQLKSWKWGAGVTVNIWDERRLKKERMGMHLAVGKGASTPPCLVHVSYRPSRKSDLRPIAFIGKGITFDTGGLDLKPAAGMRLMKKDMGGAAAVAGLAHWVTSSRYPGPCDFYLALAENSIDALAFRPSDVVVARNGLRVEIDNTDAEGRLVLGDALTVAGESPAKPEALINVATLTGAIKAGLGSEVAGLFSNDDELAESLRESGWKSGDWNWRMPLVERYSSQLSSSFADCKNSSEGFGGAVTAALFLQKFVHGQRWAHLDIYAWTDKGQGPLSANAANGQAVQCLIEFLDRRVKK